MSLMNVMKPKLLTFDVTGTLLNFRLTVGQQYAKIADSFGVHAKPELLTKKFKSTFKKMAVDHPNFGQVTGIGWEAWWKQLVFITFQESLSSSEFDPYKVERISSRLIDVYTTPECWELANSALELLGYLKDKNLPIGVISNYDPRIDVILESVNIRHYFKFVVASYEAKCQKPDLSIFKLVEQMNQNFKSNEILHIGDSPELDYLAAVNAGWKAMLVRKDVEHIKKEYPNIDSKHIVPDLARLKHCLML